MNGKLMMSLGLCLMFGLTVVSAASISNEQFTYDKKTNKMSFEFDLDLYKECLWTPIFVYDHKGNTVATNVEPWIPGTAYRIKCMTYGNGEAIRHFSRTGTFHRSYELDVVDKRDIKGLGKLDYKISHHNGLLSEGLL